MELLQFYYSVSVRTGDFGRLGWKNSEVNEVDACNRLFTSAIPLAVRLVIGLPPWNGQLGPSSQ
jgi:hypothetical protein